MAARIGIIVLLDIAVTGTAKGGTIGASRADKNWMRTFLAVLAIAGLGFLYAHHRHTDHQEAAQVQNQPARLSAPPASPVPAKMWPKKSLDRAHDVAIQVQEQRKANDNP